ncbi:NACHT, LRR and PYD domains-containing protein 3-like isoform X1 [Mauremys reevesii]|uniref:NACHT, LRR and PYD domains-containing protein 3-like isoform X1 n=1 Tax=Mauremys reevesii TaxID=260615 RepID=UPI00193F7BE2|nr:NACHT, LRR and PYD domains-containing protein 3-like isoform X1 [Mauremys reevesii]XP_039391578.1 NACHT, LRR and PYD domains-containing protein 3-like isoform X1 [Mauremys reevesii]
MDDLLLNALENLSEENLKKFKFKLLYTNYEEKGTISKHQLDKAAHVTDLVQLLIEFYSEDAVDATLYFFDKICVRDSAARLRKAIEKDYRVKYKEHIKKQYQLIKERNSRLGENVNLSKRYTKLTIISKLRCKKEREHEIMASGWRHAKIMTEQARSSVTMNSLFNPDENGQTPQIVVLQGAAGIGKTMTAKKIMLDWASGEVYENRFAYIFYINCREINYGSKQGTVIDLITKNCPDKNVPIEEILLNQEKLLFIIDGFDELRFSFDRKEDSLCTDPRKEMPMKDTLSSLFRKKLLPKSYLMITTRPTALEKLQQCMECSRYAEILGFSEDDRKEYFHKFFGNNIDATRAFDFVKQNEMHFTMCFVPIVCWITCTVMKQQLEAGKDFAQNSKTLTAVYVLFLHSLLEPHSNSPNQNMQDNLKKLCSLAADGIWKQKILFGEEEIKEYSLDEFYSLPLFLNESVFKRDIDCVSVYSFIHLSFQEFFAALFYVLEEDEQMKYSVTPNRDAKLLLENYGKSGNYLMLTVRFLFGLLNEETMKDIKKKTGLKISPKIKPDLLKWVKTKQKKLSFSSLHDELIYKLEEFHCLYEIQEESFVKSALDHFTEIDISNYSLTQMDQMVISFFVKSCPTLKSLWLSGCRFGVEDKNEELAPPPAKQICLREQAEPNNSPVYLLCQALKDPNCKLKKLKLEMCSLTVACYRDLSSALSINQTLRELDLSYNDQGNRAVPDLCKGLKHPNCKLQTLRLQSCGLTTGGCGSLSHMLRTNQTLSELELKWNRLGDSGVKLLCEGLKCQNSRLQKIVLWGCELTADCCGELSSVLATRKTLTEVNLNLNELGDSGVRRLCTGLKHPDCKLQKLWLDKCGLTASCCGVLSSVLSTSQTLIELSLNLNKLGDSGVKQLCKGLKHPDCKLQTLGLFSCDLTADCCGDLSSALGVNQVLTELDLKWNHQLGDTGVKVLCDRLKHPSCRLKKIRFSWCNLTADCCSDLSTVLSTNPILTELDLGENNLGYSGVKLLCEKLKDQNCKLRKIRLRYSNTSEEIRRELSAVETMNPHLVIQL